MVLLAVCFFMGVPPAAAAEVRVSAAASLSEVVVALAAGFQQENPGITVLANFGGSGTLAKQIAQGAPVDLFISANQSWMDYLVKEGKVAGNMVRIFVGNSLVLVGQKKKSLGSLAELGTMQRIAMGSPRSVPAGQYAEQALRAVGVYEKLLAESRLVLAQDVRQALLYAERGEVDAAFVYKTDALLAERAVILFSVPGKLHDPILCPMAVTVKGEKSPAAKLFFEYLGGEKARGILVKSGFSMDWQALPGQ